MNEPGEHLVIVHYDVNHRTAEEWVYNRADINQAKVVWAREGQSDRNEGLLTYFQQRRMWIVYPDRPGFPLLPYARVEKEQTLISTGSSAQ
jgi:hypothetical protein